MSTGKAFRAALTEKYSKLAAEAKTHSNPENYIHSKYFDKSSEYYETNLTDTERRIAYNYEMQMCRTGKINGVNYQDSLFRGIEVDGDSVDSDKIQFERALVNSQISNILKQAGVDTSSITEDYKHIISIPESSREEMFELAKKEFLNENGTLNGDTTKRESVYNNLYRKMDKDDRLSAGWTMEQYEHQYRQAFAEAAKAADPTWKAGKPIPAGALDGITRESVESGKKSVDIKI